MTRLQSSSVSHDHSTAMSLEDGRRLCLCHKCGGLFALGSLTQAVGHVVLTGLCWRGVSARREGALPPGGTALLVGGFGGLHGALPNRSTTQCCWLTGLLLTGMTSYCSLLARPLTGGQSSLLEHGGQRCRECARRYPRRLYLVQMPR